MDLGFPQLPQHRVVLRCLAASSLMCVRLRFLVADVAGLECRIEDREEWRGGLLRTHKREVNPTQGRAAKQNLLKDVAVEGQLATSSQAQILQHGTLAVRLRAEEIRNEATRRLGAVGKVHIAKELVGVGGVGNIGGTIRHLGTCWLLWRCEDKGSSGVLWCGVEVLWCDMI